MNNEMVNVKDWLQCNKLTLNLTKSHYIIFSRRKKVPPDISPLTIDNIAITNVKETVFLGVTISFDLSWRKHIQTLTSRLSRYTGV